MMIQTVRLLTKFPEVCSYYRERFQWLLVDEYQDTNPVQYNLIRLLAGNARTSAWWVTTTSRSTPGAGPTSATSSNSRRISPA